MSDAKDEPYPNAPALATASWKGQLEKVRKLVKEGANLNERGQQQDKGPTPDAPLVLAVDKDYYEVAQFLLEQGADPNIRAMDGTTPLIKSAKANKRGMTRLLLAHGASQKGVSTGTGGTALHTAVKEGADKAVEVLLDHSANIDAFANDGYAPLHEAVAKAGIAELLLNRGANPSIANSINGLQPLHMAARHGRADTCQLLLASGADVNAVSKDGLTPLHEAAEHAQAHIIKQLISRGAACMAEDRHHRTALSAALTTRFMVLDKDADKKLVASVTALLAHGSGTRPKGQAWPELTEAALSGHAAVVALLLHKGAAASDDALTMAAQCGHMDIVQLLLKHRGSAKQALGDGPNALHMAARFGHAEIVKLLVKGGADTAAMCSPPSDDRNWGASDGKPRTALQIALEHGHAATGELILEAAVKAGADMTSAALTCVDMLHKAAGKGDSSILKLLLEKVKVDPNSQHGREQHAALHVAAKSGHQSCLGILLKAGANINQRNKRGHTPLFVAVNGGHFFAVQFLAKEGADPTIAASDTRTALFAAAASANPSSLPIFNCLLETAKSKQALKDMISVRTKDGRAILHSACASSNVDVVKRLLELGTAVNVQSDDGATPLARAAACGNVRIIQMLEGAGGKVDMRNASGMTPLAYAAGQGSVKALHTLISRGANVHTRNKDGTTPLHQAAASGNHDIVTALLLRGADPKAQDKNAYMPHHDAASKGMLRALKAVLQDKRTPIDEGVHDGLTALHLAASEDNHQVIEILVAHGANVEKRSYVDGRTPLHLAASWGNVHAVKALLGGKAQIRSLDNTGKTALHWAVGAPVTGQDDFVKEQAIMNGATQQSFILNEGIVQVLYELLRRDPKGATIADDEGYLPIEIAADKACDHPSEVMSLVMKMLTNPRDVATLSGNNVPQKKASGWPTPAEAQQVQEPAATYDSEEEGEEEVAEAQAPAPAAAQRPVQEGRAKQQTSAEQQAADEKVAKAAAKRAAKKKRQRAAKREKARVEEISDDDEPGAAADEPTPAPSTAANGYLDMLFPQPMAGAVAAAVHQFPVGLPLPGQGFPGVAPRQGPAATPDGLCEGQLNSNAAAQQASAQEGAAGQRQGTRRGGKKQAQEAAEAAGLPQQAPQELPAPSYYPKPEPQHRPYQPPMQEADLQSQQQRPHHQPAQSQAWSPSQSPTQSQGSGSSHSHSHAQPPAWEFPESHPPSHAQSHAQSHVQSHAQSHAHHRRHQYDYQPGQYEQPEVPPRPRPQNPATSPPDQRRPRPQSARAPPPGFSSQMQPAPAQSGHVPSPQDEQFPPLHQAANAGGKKQQRKPGMHQAHQQLHQPPPPLPQQQQRSAPGHNWMAGFPDMQPSSHQQPQQQPLHHQQQQQWQLPQPTVSSQADTMAALLQMQQQLSQMMMQHMAGTQQGSSAAMAASQPGMMRVHAPGEYTPNTPDVHQNQQPMPSSMAMPSRQQQLESRPLIGVAVSAARGAGSVPHDSGPHDSHYHAEQDHCQFDQEQGGHLSLGWVLCTRPLEGQGFELVLRAS